MDVHHAGFQVGWQCSNRYVFLNIDIADIVLKVSDEGVHELKGDSLEYLTDLLLLFL